MTTINLYSLDTYSFGQKAPLLEKDTSVPARLARMQEKYEVEGMRRTVEGVLLVHQYNHPHVLLLQIGNSFFKLPGGRLRPGESETDGLKRKLTTKLAPDDPTYQPEWENGQLVCSWWRHHFEQTTPFLPYVPPHVTRPKECRKLFLVPLPEKCYFSVPKNLKLLAIPLFDLYENAKTYGPVISSLPLLLGRYNFNYL